MREKKESLRQPKEEEGIGGGGRTQFEALYISPKRGNFHIPLMGYKFQLLIHYPVFNKTARVSENPDFHDLTILKIETWVRGSEPQKSVPLQRFSTFFFGRKWSKVGIEPRNRSKLGFEHRTIGFSASRATN